MFSSDITIFSIVLRRMCGHSLHAHPVFVGSGIKIFLAVNSDEISRLESIQNQARLNGVEDLLELNQKELHRLEPELSGKGALFSPSSGIIDSHAFMKSILGVAESFGAVFVPVSPIENAERIPGGVLRRKRLGSEAKNQLILRL